MMDGSSGKRALRRRRGFTLMEVLIAMGIVAIAILGTIGTLLAIHRLNTYSDERSIAFRACQEVMEQLAAVDIDTMILQNGVTFIAAKLSETTPVGLIAITDVTPPGDTDSLYEISVRIQTQEGEVTTKPVDVELVTQRSRQ